MARNEEMIHLHCGPVGVGGRQGVGKPATNPNLVNGQQMTLKAFQNYTQHQKRTKGYSLTVAVGVNTFDINISGDAKMMLGFVFLNTADPLATAVIGETFTFTVNNEVIIENANPNFFASQLTNEEYYYFPRPLNGRDKVSLTINSAATTGTNSFAIYYI